MHAVFLCIIKMAIITHISYIQHTSANGNMKLLCVSSKSHISLYTVFQGELHFYNADTCIRYYQERVTKYVCLGIYSYKKSFPIAELLKQI